MSEINLLIPCSAQKSVPALEVMHISKHKKDDLAKTVHSWVSAFAQKNKMQSASALYSGRAFKYAQSLQDQYQFKISILSAGFGLVTSDTLLPGYNATFATNTNKVPTPHTSWWESICDSELPGMSITKFIKERHNEQFIISVSKEYLLAIQDDLLLALDSLDLANEKVAIVTSSVPKKLSPYKSLFVDASRKALQHPKASETGLALIDRNITSITTYLFVEHLRLTKSSFSDIIRALNEELDRLTVPKTPARKKRDDAFIISFIEQYISEHQYSSMVAAFKQYKNEGNACTDTRFSSLYNQIKLTKDQRD